MLNLIRKITHRGDVDCKEVRQLSSGYMDKELPASKQSAMRAHLSKCGPCLAFVNTLAATIGGLARLPRMPAPPSFKNSILESTSESGEKGKSDP